MPRNSHNRNRTSRITYNAHWRTRDIWSRRPWGAGKSKPSSCHPLSMTVQLTPRILKLFEPKRWKRWQRGTWNWPSCSWRGTRPSRTSVCRKSRTSWRRWTTGKQPRGSNHSTSSLTRPRGSVWGLMTTNKRCLTLYRCWRCYFYIPSATRRVWNSTDATSVCSRTQWRPLEDLQEHRTDWSMSYWRILSKWGQQADWLMLRERKWKRTQASPSRLCCWSAGQTRADSGSSRTSWPISTCWDWTSTPTLSRRQCRFLGITK